MNALAAMRDEEQRRANRVSSYRMAGDGMTARLNERACLALRHAILALEEADAAEKQA